MIRTAGGMPSQSYDTLITGGDGDIAVPASSSVLSKGRFAQAICKRPGYKFKHFRSHLALCKKKENPL